MSDYHEIVDEIRTAMQSGELPWDGALRELADGYALACAEANERLAGLTRLLNQGLRAEAIQQAEIEPNLLGMLAALDFPERPQWDALTEQRRLTRAQGLNLDGAMALNEAYAQQDPLRELLRRYRRMALAQAPLSRRLAVLRTIADKDPGTPIWREDIVEHEKARLLQVRAEAARAVTNADPATLASLVAELEDPRWSTPPPAALIRKLHDDLGHVRRLVSRRALEAGIDGLVEAFETGDLDVARRLREVWNDHAPIAQLDDNDPLIARARPALAWVEEDERRATDERAYETAVAALTAALDRDASSQQRLSALGQAVRTRGHVLPDILSSRLNARLRELSRKRLRRNLAVGAATVAATALLGFFIVQQVTSRKRESLSKKAAEQMNRLLDDNELEQAEFFLEQLPREIAGRGPMIEAATRLQKTVQDDQPRRVQLGRLIAALDHREPDRPEPPELEEIRLLNLIRLADDQAAVDRALSRYHERFEDAQADAEHDFHDQVAAVAGEIAGLERLAAGAIASPEIDRQAVEIQSRVTPLVRDASPLVRESVRPEAAGLQARLDKVSSARKVWQHQTTLETQLTRTSIMEGHDPEPFRKALTDYVKDFGAKPRGEDARRVLDDQPVWAGALAWEKLVGSWGAGSLLDPEPQLAAERAKECQRIVTDYPNCPDVALARRYHGYLEAIARREGLAPRESGRTIGVRKELEAVWHEDFAADLRVITTEDRGKRKRYYYVDPPEVAQTARKFWVFVDFVRANKKPRSFPNDKLFDQETRQAAIAANIDWAKLARKASWEETALGILRELCLPERIARQPFDPIYQFYLIKQTAELSAEGSLALEAALEPLLKAVKESEIDDTVKWMDPDNQTANEERPRAADFVNSLPPLKDVEKKIQQFRQQLSQDLAARRHAVGWLMREESAWQVRSDRPLRDGELCIAGPSDGRSSGWQNLGTAKSGELHLTGSGGGARAWVEGRPVFQNGPAR